MSVVQCRCGGLTNSAISEYWDRTDPTSPLAEGCYAKWVTDHWEQGCQYDQANVLMREMANDLLATPPRPHRPSPSDHSHTHAASTDPSSPSFPDPLPHGVITMSPIFVPGEQVSANGYDGVIVRQYSEGMYEVRLPGGVACVPAQDITRHPTVPLPTLSDTQLRNLSDATCRHYGLSLSDDARAVLIPVGPYCYTITDVQPATASTPTTHTIRPCPFWRGRRPDTVCLLNPDPSYQEDWVYNVDATKGCGINHPDDDLDDEPVVLHPEPAHDTH